VLLWAAFYRLRNEAADRCDEGVRAVGMALDGASGFQPAFLPSRWKRHE